MAMDFSDKSLWMRIRRNSFVENHLVIRTPDKWWRMTSSQVFKHNMGAGIWNDVARGFLSRAGIGMTLGIASAADSSLPSVLATTGGAIVGQRVGIATVGAAGAKVGQALGAKLGYATAGRVSGLMLGGAIGVGIGMLASDLVTSQLEKVSGLGHRLMVPDLGYGYEDTKGAATLRQRSLLAMKTSRFNARSVLGNEAYRLATGF